MTCFLISCFYIYCLGYVQVREGRNETLAHCLKREFRLTINILRTTISEDMYEVTGVGWTNFDRRQLNFVKIFWTCSLLNSEANFFCLLMRRVLELLPLTRIILQRYSLSVFSYLPIHACMHSPFICNRIAYFSNVKEGV